MSSSVSSKRSRPDLHPAGGVDQLDADPHAPAGLAHAALDHVADAEFAGGILRGKSLPLEGERRAAGDDQDRLDAGKRLGDLHHHAVDEIVLFRAAAQVGERQHGDRRPVVQRDLPRGGSRRASASGVEPAASCSSPATSCRHPSAGSAVPAREVRTLDLAERHRRQARRPGWPAPACGRRAPPRLRRAPSPTWRRRPTTTPAPPSPPAAALRSRPSRRGAPAARRRAKPRSHERAGPLRSSGPHAPSSGRTR